jgi:WS/DGAT/MGAT family acyltransferase
MPLTRKTEAGGNGISISRGVLSVSKMARDGILTAGGMAKLSAQQLLERAGVTHRSVSLHFDAAHDTPLTGSATPGREIATACLSLPDVKKVCKATRSTLNLVALSCIDGALHRYLSEIGYAVDHPMTIQMPVNLRSEDKNDAGNQLGVALVEMGSPAADPLRRLQEVGHSLHHAKQQIAGGRGDSMQQYTVMLALAGEFIEKVKLSDRVPTNGYTLISNVPGPTQPLYLNGARLEQIYPISILVPGLRSNITLFSYCDTLNIGVVATRDLENLDAFTRFIEEEFAALQAALGED